MSKNKAPLEGVLQDILAKFKCGALKENLDIVENWQKVIGKNIKDHTRPVSLKEGMLVVNVSDSSRLYELTLKKRKIVEDLNKILNKEKKTVKNIRKVKDIRFRIGEI